MASLKCNRCGYGIHYHGEPDGTEYVFVKLSDWREMERENLPSDCLELEHYDQFIDAWKCSECGTFAFFDKYGHVTHVYAPDKEISENTMQSPTVFGLFFSDIVCDEATESRIPASEILTKYPNHLWLLRNETMMRLFEDEAGTKCTAQYSRIPIAES